MNNPDSVLVEVMDSMVRARWLQSYRSTESSDWHLVWTVDGARRARLLKMVCLSHGLGLNDLAAFRFDALCHGEASPAEDMEFFDRDGQVASYWREAVVELGFKGDKIRLLGMARVLIGWAPSSDTVISSEKNKSDVLEWFTEPPN